jgi:hypothetical protein
MNAGIKWRISMNRIFIFLFLTISLFVCNSSIIILNQIDEATGEYVVLEGDIKKKKGDFIFTDKNGNQTIFKAEDIRERFRNANSYEKFMMKSESSMETLIELEKEVVELRTLYGEIIGDNYIKIRYNPNDGYEFYKYEKRIKKHSEMIDALKDYRVAMREYEELYGKYRNFTNIASAGITLSALSVLTGSILGIYTLSVNNPAALLPSGFNLDTSNQATLIAAGITGGVFLSSIGITAGGIAGRLHTRLKFVIPVEKYNYWLEMQSSSGNNAGGLRIEFSFNF